METKEIEKFDVSVILPIKSSKTAFFNDYFEKAINSLLNQKTKINELVIVHTDETSLVEYLSTFDFSGLTVQKISWTKAPSYAEQVNYGARSAKSKWISFFEFDDEYSNIWFKNAAQYAEYFPDVDAFLPIVVDIDSKGLFAGFTNEASFALSISEEMGYLTNETLQQFQNFQTSGMVIKKDKFVDFGLFKSSFKLTFGYELFLRLTHNGLKMMSIPKIGYKHVNLREGGIFWNYKHGADILTENEVKFWVDAAKKEYFFIHDRAIKYETNEN